MAQAAHDENHVPSILGVSSVDGTTPVTVFADPTTHRLYVDASVSVSGITGSLSNNNAAPGSGNLGVLPAIANAGAPSWTEGRQVLLSTDLSGALRVTGSLSVGGTTDNSAFTAGTSTGTPAMGFYHSTIDTVTDGRAASVAITSKRALMVNLQTSAGAETGIAALPLQVSLANTAANATAVKVDGSAVTQPVSAASLPLPTGAATAAKQPALGTAGTPSADVITVQGVTSMTALKVDGSAVTQPVSGTVSITANSAVNVAQINGVATTMGNGVSGTGVQRVTIASDSTGNIATIGTSVTPGTAAANLGKAEDAAAASGDTGVAVWGVRNETLTSPTSLDGDYTQLTVGSAGEVVVQQAPLSAHVTGNATATTTSDTSVVAAQGASVYFYATSITVVNTGSSTTLITFKDGNAGSTLFYGIAPAGGGITFNGGGKPIIKTSANTALYFACGTASTTVYCSVSGFKSKV